MQLTPLRFCLLQPEAHVLLPVHRRRGAEVLARLLALAGAPGELGETEVAVGNGVVTQNPGAGVAGDDPRPRFALRLSAPRLSSEQCARTVGSSCAETDEKNGVSPG